MLGWSDETRIRKDAAHTASGRTRMKFRKLRTHELGRPDPSAVGDLRAHPLRVLVENVRSAFNVGAILRTADAVRVEHVYLCGYTAPGDHPSVNKSALGAQDTVRWSHHADVSEAVDHARSNGCTLVALEQTDAPTPVASIPLAAYPICLVVGNEVEGVTQATLDRCDYAMELPQYGAKHSLNVSVAFGVAAYDLLRRWHGAHGSTDVR